MPKDPSPDAAHEEWIPGDLQLRIWTPFRCCRIRAGPASTFTPGLLGQFQGV